MAACRIRARVRRDFGVSFMARVGSLTSRPGSYEANREAAKWGTDIS
jgi:hypothetical protein